jgi:hypothetical protein
MASYEVLLANVGNIDHGQNPEAPLLGTNSGEWHPVADLEDASRVCCEYIANNDLGCGNWAGGKVRDAETQEVVAEISYNGRIWPTDGQTPGPKF